MPVRMRNTELLSKREIMDPIIDCKNQQQAIHMFSYLLKSFPYNRKH